jgi:hypothetical protein
MKVRIGGSRDIPGNQVECEVVGAEEPFDGFAGVVARTLRRLPDAAMTITDTNILESGP